MEVAYLLALALAPIAFLFTYVYLKDEYDREPLRYLIITFFLGMTTAIPVWYLGKFLRSVTGFSATGATLEIAFYSFLVVALTEEFMKFLVLRGYNYPHKEFDEPYDGIMYGVATSLGFAAVENVMYVMFATEEAVGIGILRMFTAVPGHAMFGVLMGYFVGRAKFLESPKARAMECFKGLMAAIFMHGLYDFLLFLGKDWSTICAFSSLFIGIGIARAAIRHHAENSPHRDGSMGNDPPQDPG